MNAPLAIIRDIALFERSMAFSRPFRFGDVTVREAPQAFVRVTLDVAGIGLAEGASAEMMMPRWFDRDPDKSLAQTVDDLRKSLSDAARRYLAADGSPDTAFGHHVRARSGGDAPFPALVRNFGPAQIDKAILDALFKAHRLGASAGMKANLPGLDARLTPDLAGEDIAAMLATLKPSRRISIRWTVGLIDEPDELAAELAATPLGFLKIKLSGHPDRDLERLRTLSRVVAQTGRSIRCSLDANEQYNEERLFPLVDALRRDEALKPIREGFLYLEQPFAREATLTQPLPACLDGLPAIIDEADDDYDAFPRAVARGYRGVSSKSCKGLYKALLNRMRVARRAPGDGRFALFVTGEDLTCQAGLGLQQDLALAALLGLDHGERNGHHYVDGFGLAPEAEAERFRKAHPRLYGLGRNGIHLAVSDGALEVASLLDTVGYASGASPDWASLASLASGSIRAGSGS